MNATERRILSNLLAEVRKRQTKAGCAAIVVTTEHRGHCPWRGGHSKACTALNASIEAAEKILAESAPATVLQLPLTAGAGDARGARAVS